jgi:A/G-specific adenine glycosylase
LVVSDDNEIHPKRTSKGIWQNLYEFPLIETEAVKSFDYIVSGFDFFVNDSVDSVMEYNEKSIIHKFPSAFAY